MGSCPAGAGAPPRRRLVNSGVCGAEAAWRSAGARERDEDAAAVALGAEGVATGAVPGGAPATAVAEGDDRVEQPRRCLRPDQGQAEEREEGREVEQGDGAAAEPEQERRGRHGDAQREA